VELAQSGCFLKVDVDTEAKCQFFFSTDGKSYQPLGDRFQAKKGRWIGAKVGLFCINPNIQESRSFADFEFFNIE